ncbi:MAG: hypothetical protein ACXWUP_00140 [Allosphingosinicella sp.]
MSGVRGIVLIENDIARLRHRLARPLGSSERRAVGLELDRAERWIVEIAWRESQRCRQQSE